MMQLYKIAENMRELQGLIDGGEFTTEQLSDTVEMVNEEMEDKIKSCLMVRQNELAKADAIQSEINRLLKLQKAHSDSALWISDYVKSAMLKTNCDKLDLGLFKLTLRKAPPKLGEIDESKVPSEFFTVVPESKKLDKRALLKAAKESSIDGVSIVDGERALTVK